MERGVKSVPPSYLVKYDDVRRALYRKHRKEFTRLQDTTSAECWMKEIEQRGGKGWCTDRIDNNPKTYMIAWCTRFQLQVGSTTYTGIPLSISDLFAYRLHCCWL